MGAAHQCTFCGLNGTSLGYRSKSPERVLAEVRELEDRYGVSDFEAVDNSSTWRTDKTLLPAPGRSTPASVAPRRWRRL